MNPSITDQIAALIRKNKIDKPRVTRSIIKSVIASEHYFTAAQGATAARIDADHTPPDQTKPTVPDTVPDALNRLVLCVLVLKNGYMVTGESACANAQSFSPAQGRQLAKQCAYGKVKQLLAYLWLDEKLAEKEANPGSADQQPVPHTP